MRHKTQSRTPPLEIGLLNNMSDAALQATERQFSGLLTDAAGAHPVRLRFYSLPEIPRSEPTRIHMATLYGGLDEMFAASLDGLIVTGAEPRTANLADEPYWDGLTQVIDWAEARVHGSYWSCLAAHAAVLHMDGVERTPLPAKCSGVFESAVVADDPLIAHLREPVRTPHSRLNDLDEAALVRRGYTVLTRSAEVCVDMFARRGRSLMLFGQGHPEYDADTLLKEYCRDAGRFLSGKRDVPPNIPAHYLNARTRRSFEALARREQSPALIDRYTAITATTRPRQTWRPTAVALFRGWLREIAARKSAEAQTVRSARPAAPLGLSV